MDTKTPTRSNQDGGRAEQTTSLSGRARRRRGTALAGAVCAVALTAPGAFGQTLEEALSQAYIGNPALDSARATLRSVDENVPQARALAHPAPTLTGSAGPGWTKAGVGGTSLPSAQATGIPDKWVRTNPRTVGVSITQPLYRGGLIDASISRAENAVQAQRASLLDTEQTVLLQAATAYMDVVQGQALLELQVNFEKFQKRDLEAFRDRFRVGEVTQTDVSLQEAQVASATAQRISAEGTLAQSIATYTRLMGERPIKRLTLPKLHLPLPVSLDETITLAQAKNPRVVQAKFTESAQKDSVDIADAGLLPTVGVTASFNRYFDRQSANDFYNTAAVTANLTIPLDNGSVAAQARSARQSASAARLNVEQALRVAQETAVTAWQGLVTARASIASFEAAVKANDLAAEGMRQQVAVGASTVIDLLNTEQTLLNSRVSLVRARHDEAVATFNVLSAVGQLSAQGLSLPVTYYDYEAHYSAVRDKWFGIGINE